MLLFYVGKEIFACDSELIVEIVPKVKLKKIPHSPNYFAGLLNLGGLPIPVIDFCEIIENRASSNSMHTRIILFKDPKNDNPSPILGLIAEKVTESVERELSDFIETGLKNKNFPYMGGVHSVRDQVTQFVSIDELILSMQSIEWASFKNSNS